MNFFNALGGIQTEQVLTAFLTVINDATVRLRRWNAADPVSQSVRQGVRAFGPWQRMFLVQQ